MVLHTLACCCYYHFWGFKNVITQDSVSLHHNFTLHVSTGVYGSRILSSLYILLTLGNYKNFSKTLSSVNMVAYYGESHIYDHTA